MDGGELAEGLELAKQLQRAIIRYASVIHPLCLAASPNSLSADQGGILGTSMLLLKHVLCAAGCLCIPNVCWR